MDAVSPRLKSSPMLLFPFILFSIPGTEVAGMLFSLSPKRSR
ncbi:hypothetical protein SS05631_c17150 [Sinorhizobium sp. CCBAU 05631]|nr:hypothetical protein SS05631_c17150 [Sinorhizobium sp. CCBAU 05631]